MTFRLIFAAVSLSIPSCLALFVVSPTHTCDSKLLWQSCLWPGTFVLTQLLSSLVQLQQWTPLCHTLAFSICPFPGFYKFLLHGLKTSALEKHFPHFLYLIPGSAPFLSLVPKCMLYLFGPFFFFLLWRWHPPSSLLLLDCFLGIYTYQALCSFEKN